MVVGVFLLRLVRWRTFLYRCFVALLDAWLVECFVFTCAGVLFLWEHSFVSVQVWFMFARLCVHVFSYFVCVFVWACSVRMSGHVCVCVSCVWVCGVAFVGFASLGRTYDVYRGCAVLDLFDRLLN